MTIKGAVVTYIADAEVAQLVEQRTENPCVASSSLALGTTTHPRRTIQGRSGGIGRRGGLKNHWGKPCPGSSPGFGTNGIIYLFTMNNYVETNIDNLPFEEYAQVMCERGSADFGDGNKPELTFQEIVASNMTFAQIEAEYGEETTINSGIARDTDTWEWTDEDFVRTIHYSDFLARAT